VSVVSDIDMDDSDTASLSTTTTHTHITHTQRLLTTMPLVCVVSYLLIYSTMVWTWHFHSASIINGFHFHFSHQPITGLSTDPNPNFPNLNQNFLCFIVYQIWQCTRVWAAYIFTSPRFLVINLGMSILYGVKSKSRILIERHLHSKSP